jgi:hypothetical protein
MAGNFLTSSSTVSSSGRTLFHGLRLMQMYEGVLSEKTYYTILQFNVGLTWYNASACGLLENCPTAQASTLVVQTHIDSLYTVQFIFSRLAVLQK